MWDLIGSIIFVVSPFIALFNGLLVGALVCLLLNIFMEDRPLTRLLKVLLIPLSFVVYNFVYFQLYFNFDHWWTHIPEFAQLQGWQNMALGEQLFVIFPAPLIILIFLACYVIGIPSEGYKIFARDAD